ncbi:G-type lectin S-receptor-like serine/threonine-protein kinase RLK1 [Senna tora]|uniref:Receptor-like serine/threonine-protein kinase n=1 Tax=Senna tora TaxID=362788 RepID=A0A834X3R9_9FABA|nr:G-type lectin S-receptor-like serine/threonine-protein kinase RLK1 [Senna tora]
MAVSMNNMLLCLLLLCLPTVCVYAQTKSQLSVGDSLYAGSGNSSGTWVVSPSGDFALGFQPLEGNNGVFLLSIWYENIPEKTIVWYANGDNPAPKGSKVELTAGGLVLTFPDGRELQKPETLSGSVTQGVLNDSGNFILQDKTSTTAWDTFKDPRDTVLPSQFLGNGEKLSSRRSETNFTKGRFQLVMQDDGNLVMHSINLPSEYANQNYYESGIIESNSSSVGLQLVTFMLRDSNDTYNLSSGITASPTQYYLRATLSFDGVFTLYQHPKSSFGNETWTPLWSLPDNICTKSLVTTGSGVCGYNSICSLNDYNRPVCECPKGYSLLDPNDPYGSCKPDFIQGCEEDKLSQGKDLYEFEMLINTDWPYSDYVLQRPFTEDNCKQSCMEDCMCAVAIFRLGDSCWKKKLPLSNGRVDTSLNGGKAFLKVRKEKFSIVSPSFITRQNQETLKLVGFGLFGGSAFLNLIFIGLEKATNGFEEELGRGAFGVVYKGTINMGLSHIHIAVKRLNNFVLKEIEKEFKNEVNVIGQTHHKNLVRLLGFCEEGSERLLVYEYMSNGTLASLLFNDSKPSWNLRQRIAFGIARGLVYLHEDCSTQIIHCDIKPQNILLDDYFNARISDFGLAKLLNINQSRTNTGIRGTKGYVALEWFKNMPITTKVDVYSFGVLLLEIICCRRSVDMEAENEEKAILTDWAYDCYTEGCVEALVEEDEEALEDKKKLEKLVTIAIWCVQEDPTQRPTMRKVVEMLAGVSECNIPFCSSYACVCPALIDVQELGQSKVRNSCIEAVIKKYVLRLYVTVDDLGAAIFMMHEGLPESSIGPILKKNVSRILQGSMSNSRSKDACVPQSTPIRISKKQPSFSSKLYL